MWLMGSEVSVHSRLALRWGIMAGPYGRAVLLNS